MSIKERASESIPFWNIKALDENDAFVFCETNKVYLRETSRIHFGKFLVYKDLNFILINSKLTGAMRLWVIWHEIAHFILHAPEINNFSRAMVAKSDKEANILASVCMIPEKHTRSKRMSELLDEFPMELLKIRKYAMDVLNL